ncbi:YodD family protein [Erwinia sp. PK3-005]
MSHYQPRNAEATNNPAPLLSSDEARLYDKINADSEWELAQQSGTPEGYGMGPLIARSFEFDIHDCSISEVNR